MPTSSTPTTRRRLAAIGALAAYVAVVVVVVVELFDDVGALVAALVAVVLAAVAGWFVATRIGVVRIVAAVAAVAFLVLAAVALLSQTALFPVIVVVALVLVASILSEVALGVDRETLRAAEPPGEPAPRPQHPVLLMNPWSGGGKVEKFDLEREARERGIEPVVLQRGDDLEQLARDAVDRGADMLGMAGGDGSQAIVAGVAAERGVPYVCIPAGTRNHLALDLGVDRDDVIGSLDAFTDGYERTVDLARVNGRIFVNNVSLGVYAEIVQSDAYRDAKLKTTADMLPQLLGPDSEQFSFELDAADGVLQNACLVLVSNNVYELERLGGFGSRPHLDRGELGVVAVVVNGAADVAQLVTLELAGRAGTFSGWHQWSAPTVEVRSDRDVAVGVDGEALTLPAPLRFETVPGALRVRVARSAPGVSPARVAHAVRRGGLVKLARVATGRPASARD
jgi:diacylglycerol kinase family enzyme